MSKITKLKILSIKIKSVIRKINQKEKERYQQRRLKSVILERLGPKLRNNNNIYKINHSMLKVMLAKKIHQLLRGKDLQSH